MEKDYLSELLELKNEAERLRSAIEERNKQRIEEQDKLPVSKSDLEDIAQKLAASILMISKQVEDMASRVTVMMEYSQTDTMGSIDQSLKEIKADIIDSHDDTAMIMVKALAEELESTKKEINSAISTIAGVSDRIDAINAALEDKAEKKNFIPLHQRLSTMFIVNIVGMIGSIMTLALLSYLIYSIAR